MVLGNKIKEIRKSNNLTQEQFAGKFNVTWQTVSNWENNKNYPDIQLLKVISDEYSVSFDDLFKDDEKYVKSIDDTKKKLSTLKKVLMVILAITIAVVIGFFLILHWAFQPTQEGRRINTDTMVRMYVELPDATFSRAITYTTDQNRKSDDFNSKIENFKESASGKIEGDIPRVNIKENDEIILHFQDSYYNNLDITKVSDVSADLYDVTAEKQVGVTRQLKYQKRNGNLIIKLDPDIFKSNDVSGEVWYRVPITTKFSYKGKAYTSVTALNVLDR
ncbi:MAG: helix-turn-helix transcriptional regulator [Anaerovoracaceae bacterium]